jgi:putative SOS response-associated peptidase YedK
MCYKLTTAKQLLEKEKLLQEYINAFYSLNQEDLERVYYYDGFAHPNLPVVTVERPDTVQYFRWGFIPVWAKDSKTAAEMSVMCLNAVSETIFEKPAFRSSVDKRCLVLVTGFYEWRHAGKEKYPYFIKLKNKELFYIGGLYNTWADKETGEIYNTVTLLTTPANPLMETIHNTKKRMPLILNEEMAGIWLSDLPSSEIKELMQPYDEHEMEAWTISKLITNRNANKNVPEIQAPHIYPELVSTQGSLF